MNMSIDEINNIIYNDVHPRHRKMFNDVYAQNSTTQTLDYQLQKTNEKHVIEIDIERKNGNFLTNGYLEHYFSTTVGGIHDNNGTLGACGKIVENNNSNQFLVTALSQELGDNLGNKVPKNIKSKFYNRNNITDLNDRAKTRWFRIGNCAEVRVAANFLSRYNHTMNNLQEIQFTSARRPRTNEINGGPKIYNKEIPPCNNCEIIFYGK